MINVIKTFPESSSISKLCDSIFRSRLGISIIEIEDNKSLSLSPNKEQVFSRIVEFHPGHEKILMHTTKSVDYGIVLEGEITLILKSEKHELKKGDCFIQYGTPHAWVNYSTENCKIFFVLINNE